MNEFELEEEEQEEDRIGDVVSSDSDDSDDDQGDRHAMPAQGRLVTDLPADDTPMIHGVELAKHNSMFHHHLTQRQSLSN